MAIKVLRTKKVEPSPGVPHRGFGLIGRAAPATSSPLSAIAVVCVIIERKRQSPGNPSDSIPSSDLHLKNHNFSFDYLLDHCSSLPSYLPRFKECTKMRINFCNWTKFAIC